MIIGMLVFPEMTLLDFAGPYEVFTKLPGCQVRVIARSVEPVKANGGLVIVPDTAFEQGTTVDILFVPGGPGVGAVIDDQPALAFIREQGLQARYVTSVCTGALILGAAGLLQGYRAGTHWLSLDLLPIFGAIAVPDRVVVDGNRITGGGVTAGIDFALTLAARLFGEHVAQAIELVMEYDPKPPFACGHPRLAHPDLVARIRQDRSALQATRRAQAESAAALYCNG